MATVVVPYIDTHLREQTVDSVRTSGLSHWFFRLDPTDESDYSRLFIRLWAAARTFVICEHDVAPTAEQWGEIGGCSHDWCFYDYEDSLYSDGPKFGLVKFSRRLMLRHPMAAEVALRDEKRDSGLCPWWRVDSAVCRDLTIRNSSHYQTEALHDDVTRATHPWVAGGAQRHSPPVVHLHDGPPSGPAA